MTVFELAAVAAGVALFCCTWLLEYRLGRWLWAFCLLALGLLAQRAD